ncbi:xenobiotic compound monooxygenase, DszA family, A subunit domain protein [Mycobacterium intracellulare]|nr:xenobiotic compound monooxygenase, DszA family, A subunit domain protein [Mycobacterium intracellulare]
MQREQGVGVPGAEVAAVAGVTGLQQHGVALRPGGQRGHAVDAELRTEMVDDVDARRVGVGAGVGVGDHGVGCPAVPELARDADELLGPVVSVGVGEESAAAEVLPGERVGGGDHVPRRTPVGQVVQRRELPCHLEGFVEGGVDGAGQAESVGHRGERGQHGERVGTADDVEIVDFAAVLAQPQPLGKEEEVEQPPLGGLGKVHKRFERDLAARARIRPHRRVVHPGEVGAQVYLLALSRISNGHPVSPHRLAISSCERSRSACRWVTDVMTSSSAPVTRRSSSSRSATSSGLPTNCVEVRSATNACWASVRGSQKSGSG